MRQFGDRSEFALEFLFLPDPDNGKGALPEYSQSWGQVAIWSNGKNLCRNTYKGETSPCVTWYLLPLLEWLTNNWTAIFFEETPIISTEQSTGKDIYADYANKCGELMPEKDDEYWYEWGQRHALRSCSEGGLFPDFFIRGYGDSVEFSWGNSPIIGAPDTFAFDFSEGEDLHDRNTVLRIFHEFLLFASRELNDKIPNSARVERLCKAVKSLKLFVTREALCWMLPSARQRQGFLEELLELFRDFVKPLEQGFKPSAVLMFGAYSPKLENGDLHEIRNAVRHGNDSPELVELSKNVTLTNDVKPYNQGYSLALELIDDLGLEDSTKIDVEKIIAQLKINVKTCSFNDKQMRGIALAGEDLDPVIFLNTNSRHNKTWQGKRFTCAHELCHILYDRQYGKEVGITSGPWAPRRLERRANAFAAMFLMPRDAIHERLSLYTGEITKDIVEKLAEEFNVGYIAMVSHLYNLKAVDLWKKSELLANINGDYSEYQLVD